MKFYTLKDLTHMLPVSEQVMRREIENGRLTARKLGGRIYVIDDDLKIYLDSSMVKVGKEVIE